MLDQSKELLSLIKEVNELYAYIATLKRRKNKTRDEAEKERLTEEIKMRQHQALFYIEKMENLNKEIEREG